MNATTGLADPPGTIQAAALLKQITFSQAAHLARVGSYAEAEQLLSGLMDANRTDASVVDLRARIRAQQGALLDAETLWKQVLQIDSAHPCAQAALARVHAMQRYPVSLVTLWPLAVGSVVVAVCLALIYFDARQRDLRLSHWNETLKQTVAGNSGPADLTEEIRSLQSSQQLLAKQMAQCATNLQLVQTAFPKLEQEISAATAKVASVGAGAEDRLLAIEQGLKSMTDTHPGTESSTALAENTQRIDGQLNELRSALSSNLLAGLARQPAVAWSQPTPWPEVKVNGIRQTKDEKTMTMIFDEGIFDHGMHFRLGAKERVAAAMKALAQSETPFTLLVTGYSDNDQGLFGASDSYALGLKRAAEVVDFIRFSSLFPPNRIQVASSGSAHLPFPSDTEANHSRNRTVVLKLSRGEP